jgi:hypothetical protein
MGGGANNTPLLSNDSKDRGIALDYYDTAARTAFVGYDNSINKLIAATRVNITNEVVTVSSYGTLVVGTLEGSNVSITGDVNAGNVISVGFVQSATVSASGNVTGGNVITGGLITATGNIQGGNLRTAGLISATGTVTGSQFNGSGAGLTSIPGANVTGTVSSATTAGTVTTAAQSNITSVGTLTGLTVSGSVTMSATSGNWLKLPTSSSDPAGAPEGAIYYNTGSDTVRLLTGSGWTSL